MKLLKRQKYYFLFVPHESTLEGAFKWWITNRNKNCSGFCPLCELYYRCQEDTEAGVINTREKKDIWFIVLLGILSSGILISAIYLTSEFITRRFS